MAARKRNDRQRGSNAGTIFWLAAIIVILFVFALNWNKIQATLASTNFHEVVKTQTGAGKSKAAPSIPQEAPKGSFEGGPGSPSAAQPGTQVPEAPPSAPQTAQKPPSQSEPKSAQPPDAQGSQAKPAGKPQVPAGGAQVIPVAPNAPAAASQVSKSRNASLFFVRVDDDGVIVHLEVKRQVAVSDSPLLDSMSALLSGPSEDEIRKKLITLVPQGTKLLSAQVRGSTAYLNFNEAFMYNHYGIEGYAGQLKQVVYTATAFPNVQDVQILIEGAKRDYLGGEGVYIGRPLSRNSF
jgi:hypothetical protein